MSFNEIVNCNVIGFGHIEKWLERLILEKPVITVLDHQRAA